MSENDTAKRRLDQQIKKLCNQRQRLDYHNRQLQRHYPEAVAPGSGAPNCCGRVCQPRRVAVAQEYSCSRLASSAGIRGALASNPLVRNKKSSA